MAKDATVGLNIVSQKLEDERKTMITIISNYKTV